MTHSMQTRAMSLLESIVNVAVGISVAFASQIVVFPLCGISASIAQNIQVSAWFTAISLARSYVVRRIFNR